MGLTGAASITDITREAFLTSSAAR